jgi:hypothetical protein
MLFGDLLKYYTFQQQRDKQGLGSIMRKQAMMTAA